MLKTYSKKILIITLCLLLLTVGVFCLSAKTVHAAEYLGDYPVYICCVGNGGYVKDSITTLNPHFGVNDYTASNFITRLNDMSPNHSNGYDFLGWSTSANGEVIANDSLFSAIELSEPLIPQNYTKEYQIASIYAIWDIPIYYTVTFDSAGGSAVDSQQVANGDYATVPTAPTRTDYNFVGWSPAVEDTAITVGTVFTAQWEREYFTLFLEGCCAKFDDGMLFYEYRVEKPLYSFYVYPSAFPKFTWVDEGYVFVNNWSATIQGTPIVWPIAYEELKTMGEIYALFVEVGEQYHTVSFDSAGGTEVESIQVINGGYVGALGALPQRYSYSFNGWDKDLYNTCITSDTVFTAKWQDPFMWPEHNVIYYTNGGIFQFSNHIPDYDEYWTCQFEGRNPLDYSYVEIDPLIGDDYTISIYRTGYTFAGWSLSADGDVVALDSITITAEIHLYAQWEFTGYLVTFDVAEGIPIANQYLEYGSYATVPDVPIRVGYKFLSWLPAIEDTEITADTVFVAQWEAMDSLTFTWYAGEISEDAYFVVDGAQVAKYEQIVAYNDYPICPYEPIRVGYVFTKWHVDPHFRITSNYHGVIAKWAPADCTVTFDSVGGSAIDSQQVTNGSYATVPADPIKEGYTFVGWTVEDSIYPLEVDKIIIKDHTTFYAIWQINYYTVTFDLDGGDPIHELDWQPQQVAYGGYAYVSPFSVTKQCFNFVGWLPAIENTPITSDTVFMAIWEIEKFTVNFCDYDPVEGSNIVLYSQQVDYGSYATVPADPTKTGYTFIGWTPSVGETIITSNRTFTAQWEPIYYTVTFDSAGGSEVESQQVQHGERAITPISPTREGYSFAGWNKPVNTTVIIEDTTFTAQWTRNYYTVMFDTVGGSAIESQIIEHGSYAVGPEASTREGYTFIGWSPSISNTAITQDTVFTAQWQVIYYTVTFDTVGGTAVNSQQVAYGSYAVIPDPPTRAGYTFYGWSPAVADTPIVSNTVFIAQWEINYYTVTFDTVGGNTVNSQQVAYGSYAVKPSNPVKVGHKFVNWLPAIEDTPITSNTVFTAKWRVLAYVVSFDTANGSEIYPQSVEYGDYAFAPHTDPSIYGKMACTCVCCEF